MKRFFDKPGCLVIVALICTVTIEFGARYFGGVVIISMNCLLPACPTGII